MKAGIKTERSKGGRLGANPPVPQHRSRRGGPASALTHVSAILVLVCGAFSIAHYSFSLLNSQVVVNESSDQFAGI